MPATSHFTLTNNCHSFAAEQHADKRDASNRIPRPPNAFMLYRSDFLKRRAVPPEVEKRQQNLSRIAGQCWNMLPDTEKAVWHSKATVVRAEHRARYPSRKPGSFHKGSNRPSVEDKRRGSAAEHPLSPIRRSRPRQTRLYQSPYCEGMFAALYDTKKSLPDSQTRLLSPISALESPLSSSATPSSPLFPLRVHSDWNDSLSSSVTHQNQMIPRNSIIHSSDSGALRCSLTNQSQDLEIPFQTLSEIAPAEPCFALLPNTFATCILPQPRLEPLPMLRGNPLSEMTQSDTRSPAGHPLVNNYDHLTDCEWPGNIT